MKLNRILHNRLFIVVFSFTVDSLCYHTITNTGFKVAEAVNFATGDCFVKKKKLSACLCGDTHVRFSASTRIRMHNYATSEKNKLLSSPTSKGDHLIREFMLRHDYKCKFYCVINDQGICYKAFVFNEENSDYVNLSKLPFDVQYMAYYLQDTISFNFNKN